MFLCIPCFYLQFDQIFGLWAFGKKRASAAEKIDKGWCYIESTWTERQKRQIPHQTTKFPELCILSLSLCLSMSLSVCLSLSLSLSLSLARSLARRLYCHYPKSTFLYPKIINKIVFSTKLQIATPPSNHFWIFSTFSWIFFSVVLTKVLFGIFDILSFRFLTNFWISPLYPMGKPKTSIFWKMEWNLGLGGEYSVYTGYFWHFSA